jgi:atypical dual specificity phosphatase
MVLEPQHFSWVVDDVLAAMARPFDLEPALDFLQDQGIDVVVTLLDEPLDEALVRGRGMEYYHIAVADFTAPTQDQIELFVEIVEAAREAGKRVVAHCHAGMGRTGTMLAAYLAHLGYDAWAAIDEVRRLRPGSIETPEQEDAVVAFSSRVRARRW